MRSEAFETLFGGAAGGGKSHGQLLDALRFAVVYPGSRQLMLRRTMPELERSLVPAAMRLYPQSVASYKVSEHRWDFINGSTLEFGYCDAESDVTKYQSAEYDVIRFDELTHFTESQFTYLISRIRGANPYPKQVKSTTNPGGIGMNGEGRRTAHVLERAFASAIERSGVKALGRPLLKNACVDGDACFYVHFDPALETGQAVKGDIAVDLIDSTNICFGNPACDEVQRQPYIIIAMRRDVDEVRREARENGISEDEISAIRADDAGEYHRWRVNGGEERVTVLLHMRRVEGGIAFCKTVRNATVMREKVLPYRLYPVTHLCWNRVRGSCHGESPLTEAIPNQIAINKLYSMYVQCIKQVAFPKIVYDMTRFPNGWSNDVGKAIAMRGNPNEAIAAAFRAPDISAQVLQLLRQMMTDTMELMGASEASLGTVRPDNTSAIIAVQSATAAPLELTKMEFYRFTEDWARIFLDMMGVHYGVRTLVLPDEDGGEPDRQSFDFSTLAGQDMRLQVDVGAASYWSEIMQTTTSDHLLESGVISDPLVYLENVPDYQVRGKHDLLHALRMQRQTQKEETANAGTEQP